MNYGDYKQKSLIHNSCFMIHVGIVLAVFFAVVPFLYAATEEELRSRMDERTKEIERLEAEIAAYRQTLAAASNQSKTLQGEVSRIETQIKKLSADIRLTENRIGAAELHIEELDKEIAASERKISSQRAALAQALQTLYQDDGSAMIEILLQNGRISDFFGHLDGIESLEKSIHDDLGSLRDLKTALVDERASRETHKDELARLQRELADRRGIEESAKGEKSALLAATKNEEARYKELLAERAAKREEMLYEIQQIEDDLRALINPSDLPSARTGVLAWPLKGNVMLTQSFGTTPDSKILYNGKPHNGIDLRADIGTPLYAAENGVIKEIGDTDAFPGCLSYGKWILIEHANNLATLSAHLSRSTVVKGQAVTRGDLIGYTGATGYATGPHLHFTVYDASTVQFRKSKIPGSNCQFLPYGGYLNPLAYL